MTVTLGKLCTSMFPVSGALQLNIWGAHMERPKISHRWAYSKLLNPAPTSRSAASLERETFSSSDSRFEARAALSACFLQYSHEIWNWIVRFHLESCMYSQCIKLRHQINPMSNIQQNMKMRHNITGIHRFQSPSDLANFLSRSSVGWMVHLSLEEYIRSLSSFSLG